LSQTVSIWIGCTPAEAPLLQVHVLNSYCDIAASEWDALVEDRSPFLEHAFLFGLERFDCAVPDTGWVPRPVIVRDDAGLLVAAAPAWVKTHSMGEFVYDHAWADAAQRAGFRYFPKLVVAVPFTPVTGDRLLLAAGTDPDPARKALLGGLQAASEDCHGLHILFNPETEARALEDAGSFTRLQYQFHWKNRGYENFDDFLGQFRSRHRKKIRRERRDAGRLQIDRIHGPSESDVATMHRFYRRTCAQFGHWGRVYLSEPFFRHLQKTWGDRLLFVFARDGDEVLAGSFNVGKGDRMYGRYWGCAEEVKFLHFELCYYQTIEHCIAEGLATFEPGHGGGHKYRRGFETTLTYSSHWLLAQRLHEGLRHHTLAECAHVRRQAAALSAQSPLKL